MAEAPPKDMAYFVTELKEDMIDPAARELFENYSKIPSADVILHIKEFAQYCLLRHLQIGYP
jgi:hypothetical protein